MAVFILIVFMTAFAVLFLAEVKKENRTAAAELVISKAWNQCFARQDLEEKKEILLKENTRNHRYNEKKLAKKIKNLDKQMEVNRKTEASYLSGKAFSMADGITLFGYQLLTDLGLNAENETFRKLISSCEHSGYIELERTQETAGQKNSYIYAYYLIASLVSHVFAGLFLAVFLACVLLASGKDMKSVLLVSAAALAGMSVLGFLPYDSLRTKAQKRQDEIDREFPNVISKVALLVTAGMSTVKALEETAGSNQTTMYLELQKVVKEVNQAATLEAALVHLQCRCDNRYLDKMVSIISKSYTAGNANLADNLREINGECWLDKKHNTRRMSEAVQNKLFIPTMLMFIGILVVIIVPAMSGFGF